MSSINSESVVYEISLSAEAKEEVFSTEKKVQDLKEIVAKLEAEINTILEKPIEKKTEDETPSKPQEAKSEEKKDAALTEGEKFIKNIDSKGLGNLRSLSSNPETMLSGQFLSFLTKGGPQTAIIAALISAAVSSPETLNQIIKALAAPGGPLNRDWRRMIDKQVDIGLSRAQIERRQVGRDILVLPQKLGFVPQNEAWASSNLFEIDFKKVARIGLTQKEEGLFE